jgi:carboxyl-terminal processing protease
VDYAHRNEDGSVGFIPDSLIREFSTKNGRKVFDFVCISPDIALELIQYSNIAVSLVSKNLIFDYATLFAVENPAVSAIDALKVTDERYADFLKFLQGKNYDYTTESNDKLEELIKVAKQEKYYAGAQTELEALASKLAHDKDKDLKTFSDEISTLLHEELASRYFYQKGRILASLEDDPELAKAIEILQNPALHSSVLQKSYGAANVKAGMSVSSN